jgi:glutamate dehydrogenase
MLSPPEVVSAILAAPVDLLWLGGIGTFVKAANESGADVGDRLDDQVRIDADHVRARVVAEGGNLGFTQRARIQYSRRGGRINADFIDNAAGVATSDREVNLKILLALAIERARLAPSERDQLLAQVSDDVAAEVLRQVGLSAAAITRAVPDSAADLDAFEALMTALEVAGRLDRKVEALPDAEEISTRRTAGAGLTRPEVAVLLAHAKSDLTVALAASPLMADPELQEAVEAYFPTAVTDRFSDLIPDHRLFSQLAATAIANEIVDRMGVTWAHETADELGVSLADVAAAYWAARQVLSADRRWRQLEGLSASIPADAETTLHGAVAAAVRGLARTYLERRSIALARFVREDWPAVPELDAVCKGLATPEEAAVNVDAVVEEGVDRAVAEDFTWLGVLSRVADVAQASRDMQRPVDQVAEAFLAVDAALNLSALETRMRALQPRGRWERWQLRGLLDDVARMRRDVATAAVGGAPPSTTVADAVANWIAERADAVARIDRLAKQVDGRSGEALAVAALAVRALSELV